MRSLGKSPYIKYRRDIRRLSNRQWECRVLLLESNYPVAGTVLQDKTNRLGYAMNSQPRVLLVSSDEAESCVLEGILSEHVDLRSIRDIAELQTKLDDGDYDAIFCGWSLHRGTWNDVLREVRQGHPNLPVVVFCRTGGEREWVQVLEAGAFDLLSAPYLKAPVLAVMEQAVESYEARRRYGLALVPQPV